MAKKPHGDGHSKYKPEFCEQLIEHMSKGYSYESFASKAKVYRTTLYDWENSHPEWCEAKEEAFLQCLLWWESQGIEGLWSETEYNEKGKPTKSKSINSTLWIFNMKNRFKWRDKQPDEIDTQINNSNTQNVSALSDEDLKKRAQELMEKIGSKK